MRFVSPGNCMCLCSFYVHYYSTIKGVGPELILHNGYPSFHLNVIKASYLHSEQITRLSSTWKCREDNDLGINALI